MDFSEIDCIGSSLSDIEKSEMELNVKLPQVYKEFLLICGDKPNHVFCGSTVETRHLSFIQDSGRKCYKTVTGQECPEYLFFILEHQDYSYYYFDINSGERPDVFLLIYGDENTNENYGKLDTLLEKELRRVL